MSEEKGSKELALDPKSANLTGPVYPRPSHPWIPGPIISEPDPVIKVLPAGIVRALPACESGRAFLELQNDTEGRVKIDNALAMFHEAGPATDLLRTWVELKPEEHRRVEITEALRGSMPGTSGTWRFRILLALNPEPRLQPGPGAYRAALTDGRFEEFTADRS